MLVEMRLIGTATNTNRKNKILFETDHGTFQKNRTGRPMIRIVMSIAMISARFTLIS